MHYSTLRSTIYYSKVVYIQLILPVLLFHALLVKKHSHLQRPSNRCTINNTITSYTVYTVTVYKMRNNELKQQIHKYWSDFEHAEG